MKRRLLIQDVFDSEGPDEPAPAPPKIPDYPTIAGIDFHYPDPKPAATKLAKRMRPARAKVHGRIDGAKGATITIDRMAEVIAVRPFHRHRTYELPLLTVAKWILESVAAAEAPAKRKRRLVPRRKL